MRTSYLSDPSRQDFDLVFQHVECLSLRMPIFHLPPYQRHERYPRREDIIRITTFNDPLGVFFDQCQEHVVRKSPDRIRRDHSNRRLSGNRSVRWRNQRRFRSRHCHITVFQPNFDGRFKKIEFEISRPQARYRTPKILPYRTALGATQVNLPSRNAFLKIFNQRIPSVRELLASTGMTVGVQRRLPFDHTPWIAKITWTVFPQLSFAEVPLCFKDDTQPSFIAPVGKRVMQRQIGCVGCGVHESPSDQTISRQVGNAPGYKPSRNFNQ